MTKHTRVFIPLVALLMLLATGIAFNSTSTAQSSVGIQYGSNWTAVYYNDTSFGTPVNSQTGIAQLNITYGTNAPFNAVNPDNFSIRFSTTEEFFTGTYRFSAQVNDGVRVIIDGTTIINELSQSPNDQFRLFQVDAAITGGVREIVVEFVEFTGNAAIQFYWEPVNVEATATEGPSPTPTATGLPPIPPGALTGTVIRAGVLNTRSAPSLGGDVVRRILRGQTYQIVGRDPDARWFLLELGDVQAWAYGYYLFFNRNEFTAPIRSASTVFGLPPGFTDTGVLVQTCATMKLRGEPNLSSEQTGRITWGAFLPVAARSPSGDWYQVLWKGTTGWMFSGFSRVVQGDYANIPVVDTIPGGFLATPPITTCRRSTSTETEG